MKKTNRQNPYLMPTNPIVRNRAKIIATLGPASCTEAVIRDMIAAGVSVFRLNMSHGDHDTHRRNIQRVRKIAAEAEYAIGIMADLQGPKLRTGELVDHVPVLLEEGATVTLKASEEPGTASVITTDSRDLIEALLPGSAVLINDGMIRLKVTEKPSDEMVLCEVIQGGELNERKGINVPDTPLTFRALTDKDKEDALFAVREQVDFVALSFVRCAEDIQDLKGFITDQGFDVPPIIAKIEKPQALDDIDRILEESFALMVARGDLGVELSAERVPVIQKRLIEKATYQEKPIIVATQMLESMITSRHPSRAEVSDVANAVFDGADALMLSGETAVGQHPVAVVTMMRQVIEESEKHYQSLQSRPHEASSIQSPHFHHTIAHAASYASIKANVKAIVVLSNSGSMALRISKLKPPRPIVALTQTDAVCNRMSLLWGVLPLKVPFAETTEETLNRGEELLLKHHLLTIGDSVLFCAGQTHILGATNMLKFLTIGEAVRSSIGIL